VESPADKCLSEIARQIHPDRHMNEVDSWSVREQFLAPYRGPWISFAEGAVIAFDTSPVAVFHAAAAIGLHLFVAWVAREGEPCRMRRVSCPDDATCPGEPLPVLSVAFHPIRGAGPAVRVWQ
jgi:hypothetical protein